MPSSLPPKFEKKSIVRVRGRLAAFFRIIKNGNFSALVFGSKLLCLHSLKRKDPDNRLSLHLEAPSRIELENKAFAELCLTAWPWRHSGAVDEIRTRDIHLGKVALYH